MRFGARLRRLHLDLTPLRASREFRLVMGSGVVVTSLGSFVTYVALPFQVKDLTDSYIAVGLLGACELIPLIFFGLWGGSLSDAWDRRRMVIFTEIGLMACSTTLLVNAILPEPHLWLIYLVAMFFAAFDSLQRPSLDAIIPRVVAHDQLAAASALTSLRQQVASLAGPAIGGILVARYDASAAYAVDVATYAFSLTLLWRLAPVPPINAAESVGLRHISKGLSYAWGRKDLLGTYLVDTAAMLLAFPMALLPLRCRQPRRGVGAGLALHRSIRRRTHCHADERLDLPREPTGARNPARGRCLGGWHRRFRAIQLHLVGAGVACGRGRCRHDFGHFPHRDVEPDHSGRGAGAHGGS